MGLDMYLYRKKRRSDYATNEDYKQADDVQLMYWRKANQIHSWFTQGAEEDNCTPIPVTEKEILKLIDLCIDVLAEKDDAEELLPTVSGFFWGDTEYNEYYYQDISDTLQGLSEALDDIQPNDKLYYYAWY
jgi:hypothetical protein